MGREVEGRPRDVHCFQAHSATISRGRVSLLELFYFLLFGFG